MDTTPIEWVDGFADTKQRKVFTFHEHGIPGLRMFGYHNTSHAIAPLDVHFHRDCFEFTFLVQGNLRFFVGDKSYPLSGGDMYVTFPNEVHSTGNIPLSLHQMYWFQLETDDPSNLLFMNPEKSRWLVEQLNQLNTRVIKMEPTTENLLRQIFSDIAGGTEVGKLQAAALLEVLLCQILVDSRMPCFHITPDIGRATEYILDHIEKNLTMEELAGVALLSVSRFKQKFKDEMGTSPRNFINFHKIEAAKRLLQEGMNVTGAAMSLGFSGSDYFAVVFRRYTSVSPSQYVRNLKKIAK